MITTRTMLYDILDFAEMFIGKPGGILINTGIRAHTEDRRKIFEEDIWKLGEPDEMIGFVEIRDFLWGIETAAETWSKHGTYCLEGIQFTDPKDSNCNVQAKLLWGT